MVKIAIQECILTFEGSVESVVGGHSAVPVRGELLYAEYGCGDVHIEASDMDVLTRLGSREWEAHALAW
eukprot:2579078-Rhodomonas_salina.1